MSQAAAGLEYIHGQGFIHGNLKATNTYLDAQRRLLLSEFGLSQPAGETTDPYRSPEQVQGGLVDKRTDVYAMGVLLYELLTGGQPPAGVVASPNARQPDLPEAVERVVLKAMAQNPDQRFQSTAAFREALKQAVQVPGAKPQAPAAGAPAAPPGSNPHRLSERAGAAAQRHKLGCHHPGHCSGGHLPGLPVLDPAQPVGR